MQESGLPIEGTNVATLYFRFNISIIKRKHCVRFLFTLIILVIWRTRHCLTVTLYTNNILIFDASDIFIFLHLPFPPTSTPGFDQFQQNIPLFFSD